MLRVKQDVDVVDDSGDLKGTDARKDVVVWVVIVLVGDELAVDLLLEPGLGDFVHDAVGIGDLSLDGRSHLVEDGHVFGLVVACVPLMAAALSAHFKHERCLVGLGHLFAN